MSCNKIKATCTGVKTFSVCTAYESNVNSESSLNDSTCLNIEETTADIYDQLEGMSTEGLGALCLTYVLEENKILVKNVLKKFEQEICDLKNKVETLENRKICDLPISECLANFGCLGGECDNSIVTLSDWMLAMQTKICTS